MKDIEKAIFSKVIPWTEIELRTRHYWAFKDVTKPDKLFFTPSTKNIENMLECYKAAYTFGYLKLSDSCSFLVSQEVSNSSEIDYPYIELTFNRI